MKNYIIFSCILSMALYFFTDAADAQKLSRRHETELKHINQHLNDGRLIDAENKANALMTGINRQFGDESLEAMVVLQFLATIKDRQALHEQSISLRLKILNIHDQLKGREHRDTPSLLNEIAGSFQAVNKHEHAVPLFERAISIAKKMGHERSDETIAILISNLATSHYHLSNYGSAAALHKEALAIFELVFGSRHLEVARSISDLATVLYAMQDYTQVIDLESRAIDVLTSIGEMNSLQMGHSANNLALAYFGLGRYLESLQQGKIALEIYERSLGKDSIEIARLLNSIAYLYDELGRPKDGEKASLEALDILRKRFGADHWEYALGLAQYSSMKKSQGEFKVALANELQAIEILRVSLGSDHRFVGELYSNIGLTYFRLGDYTSAKQNFMLALGIAEKRTGPDSQLSSLIIHNLGKVFLKSEDFEGALLAQKRALFAVEKSLGELHPHTAKHRFSLAEVYFSLGLFDAAALLSKSAVNVYQLVRHDVSKIGSMEAREYSKKVSEVYGFTAQVLIEMGHLAEAQAVLDMLKEDEQFDFIRRSSSADPRRTRIGYTPTEERWMSRYREIADRLAALGREEQTLQKQAKLGLTDEQKRRQTAVAADLKVAQAAFESFLARMRQEFAAKGPARSVEFSESSVKALAELQGLLKSLGDDVVLLQIYLTEEQVNFLLTTPGVQLARSVKIKVQDLNRQVAGLNRLLRDPKSDPVHAAQTLYKVLLAPVEQDLQQAGAKTVMLSLDGVLRYLPFGVLHDGERYALQRWNLPIYTSVVRERLRDAANSNWQAAGLGVTRRHGDFEPLPAVRTEMNSIIRSAASGVLPGEIHLDEAFTAKRLKDVSQRRFPVVHIASHFRFSPGTEVNSFLLLGDGTQLTLGDMRTQNYRFDDVDLLTLSACETGLGGGRDQRGREIEGFGVIAQQQGAKAVLATLWKVADSSTATLMGDMYRRRTQFNLSKIEALRQAQIALASQPRTSHPFFWAPFVLMGNWK